MWVTIGFLGLVTIFVIAMRRMLKEDAEMQKKLEEDRVRVVRALTAYKLKAERSTNAEDLISAEREFNEVLANLHYPPSNQMDWTEDLKRIS